MNYPLRVNIHTKILDVYLTCLAFLSSFDISTEGNGQVEIFGWMYQFYIAEKKDELDEKIKTYLKGWTMDRISKTDLAILRLAVYEMLYREDIPCLNWMQALIHDDCLTLHIMFRSNDIYQAFPAILACCP